MKVIFSEGEKEREKLQLRMDRFDAVLCEYCRKYRKSVEQVAQKVGCSTASLWRYRTQIESFRKAPLDVVANCFKLMNISNHDLRFILGLPTGKADEET